MFGAFLYLRLTLLRNLLASRLRRLRQPKYLVGALVGIAYFYMMFFRHARRAPSGRTVHFAMSAAEAAPTVVAVGALVVFVILFFCWVVPDQRGGLNFTEAEIAFLFPAPVSRRTLIHYKLISSQLAILLTSVLFTLFTRTLPFISNNPVMHTIGWWFILATINLHMIASGFVMTKWLDRGISPLRRRVTAFALLIGFVVVLAVWIGHEFHGPTASDGASLSAMARYVAGVLALGPLPWLLAPFKAIVGPFLAYDAHTFLLALGPAAAVFALHYLWVLRTEISFEEASIAKAEKRAARVAAARTGRWGAARGPSKARTAPFKLGEHGRAEIAFLWKNLLGTHPWLRPKVWSVAALVIFAGTRWLLQHYGWQSGVAISGVTMIVGGYILFLGPQFARQDLRGDLLNSDILKVYPLRGWQIVLGEVLTPVAVLTGLLWLVILTLTMCFQIRDAEWFDDSVRLTLGVCCAAVTPFVCTLQILVPNAATLLFPAWMQSSRNRAERGIEVMGQRIIFFLGQFLVVLVALLPAALLAGLLIFASQWVIGAIAALALATLVVIAVLTLEIWLGLQWLGGRFEAFDLSAELRN